MNLSIARFIQSFVLFYSTIFFIFFSQAIFAKYDPDLEWHTQETPHFLFHYHDGLQKTVVNFTQHAEKIHKNITAFFDWQPNAKTHVILSDHFDSANGQASPFPNNVIEMRLTPPSDITGLEDFENWQYLLFEHEYVHIIQLDMANDFPLDLRSILGRHWLLFPSQYLPKWIIEGIATYIETHEENGTGRGQSSYFRALMRNEVKSGIRSLYQVNQAQLDWPGGTNRYLYGVYFFKFLEKTYGKKSIQEFFQAYSRFPIPYFINTVFKQIYNKGLYELWDEFQNYLHNEFDAEINQPRSLQNNAHQLSSSGFHSGFSKILDNGDVLFIRDNQEDIKSLVRYNPKLDSYTTLLKSVAISSSFDIHPKNGVLIPMEDWIHSSRLVTDLYQLNLDTLTLTQLTLNQRYIRAIWHPNGKQIIALKNDAGHHTLDLLDKNGKRIKTIWDSNEGVVIGTMAISPQGSHITASIFRPDTGWNLETLDINKNRWTTITNNKSIESHPQYTNNGKKLIYTAEYSGIYNIYELTLAENKLQQLTDSDTAALYPSLDESSDILYYAKLDHNGFNLHALSLSPVPHNVNYPLDSQSSKTKTSRLSKKLEFNTTSYNALKYLKPAWWEPLPLVLVNNEQTTLGLLTSSNDPIKRHYYALVLAYDIKNRAPLWNIQYTYSRFLPEFTLSANRANFFPDDTLLRQERSASLSINLPLSKINNNWNVFTTFKRVNSQFLMRSNLDKVNSSYNDDLVAAGINWRTTSQPTIAVYQYSGLNVSLSYEINRFSKPIKPHSRIILNTSLYSPLILKSVAELNGTIVASGGNAGNLFVGGDGIELFNRGPAGKRSYSLAGYKDGSFVGSNLQKIIFNIHIPVTNPQRSIMTPPIGLSRIKLLPFFQTARVDSFHNINHAKWHNAIGTELSIYANFGYGLFPFIIKTGLAKGISNTGIYTAYFSILSQFI